MNLDIKNLENKSVGKVDLSPEVFQLPIRKDILSRMVNYQLAKRRAGTHKAKGISDISGTTRKPFKQKGTGNARQGSLRSAQMRGGACIFGPVPRSHAIDLPKKVRKLALKTALSVKAQEGKLVIIENLKASSGKTKDLQIQLGALGFKSALIIDGPSVNENFKRAAHNIMNIDVLPQQGVNVYDILRRDLLVLSVDALKHLEERLK
jgi:large subunit ribosomal protein L4